MSRRLARGLPRAARWASPLLLLLLAGAAPAEEFYYVAMFGADHKPIDPNYSHTFATFVRACGDGPCPKAFTVEDCFTISWLPVCTRVRTHALLPECGHNFTLSETLDITLGADECVTMWGPYRIDESLYCLAQAKFAQLESGCVRYKALDGGYRSDRASNCIHAVSSVVEGDRRHIGSPGYGETASWFCLQKYKPYIIDDCQTQEWVYSYLGLDKYPITRRDFERSTRPPVYWNLIKEGIRVIF